MHKTFTIRGLASMTDGISHMLHCGNQIVSALQARIASQAVCVGKHVWLIGGWDPGMKRDGGEILSDIWCLDTDSWNWTEPQIQVSVLQDIVVPLQSLLLHHKYALASHHLSSFC